MLSVKKGPFEMKTTVEGKQQTVSDINAGRRPTVACITQHLMQMLRASHSHHNNRRLLDKENRSRTHTLIQRWVDERLANLNSTEAERAAKELYSPFIEYMELRAHDFI